MQEQKYKNQVKSMSTPEKLQAEEMNCANFKSLVTKYYSDPSYKNKKPNEIPEIRQILNSYFCCWSCGSQICREKQLLSKDVGQFPAESNCSYVKIRMGGQPLNNIFSRKDGSVWETENELK